MVTHSSDCDVCLALCKHYINDAMDNNQELNMARRAQDHARSLPRQTKVAALKRRQVKTLQKLATMRQKVTEARAKLAQARRAREHLLKADKKPRRRLADASDCHRVMTKPQDGLEKGRCISPSKPSSFQLRGRTRPPSYHRPTVASESQATEHETIYVSSDSDVDISHILPPSAPILGSSSVTDARAAAM
jgi:hypothetical protein